MTELNSPGIHIYISSRLSRMFKQRVRNRNLEGHIKGKVRAVNFIKIDRQLDVPTEPTFILKD